VGVRSPSWAWGNIAENLSRISRVVQRLIRSGYNQSTAPVSPHIQHDRGAFPEDRLVTFPDDERILTSLHSADDLVQAGLNGRISRRGLIVRARDLGLAAGVTAILLNATGLSARAADKALVTDGKKTKPAGKEVKDGQITVGVVGSIDTLNPYTTNLYAQGFDVLSGVMDGLVGYDSRQRLKPVLAEGYSISDDGLTYTFKIRPNVAFQNGDLLTAKDVVASWQMIMNKELPVWSRLGWDKIASIDTPDDRTAVVKTAQLFAPFLSSIAAGQFTNCAICPASELEKGLDAFRERFDTKPIGTGPFRVKSVRQSEIILERYAKHWAGNPRLERITVRIYKDYAEQLAALAAGEIQVANRTGTPGSQNVADALAIPSASVFQFPGLTWGHLDLKNVSYLMDTRVRQALDYATPKDEIIKQVLNGHAQVAAADQAPGSWAYSQPLRPRDLDYDRASSLMERAGFKRSGDGKLVKDGDRFEIDLWGEEGDAQAEPILHVIAASWAKIGVSCRVNLAPAAELWGPTGYQFTDRMTAGYYRWANVNDPDDMFYWHSSQIPTHPGGAGGNVPAFFNEYSFQSQIDDLTSRAAAETDPIQRKTLYLEIQDLLHEQVPAIFLFWDYNYSAAATTLGNYLPNAYTYLLWNAREWYLASGT
jgi:peptide/nickel transport system substrate-binding protein